MKRREFNDQRIERLSNAFQRSHGIIPRFWKLEEQIQTGAAERIVEPLRKQGGNDTSLWKVTTDNGLVVPVVYHDKKRKIIALLGESRLHGARDPHHADRRARDRHGIQSGFTEAARRKIRNGGGRTLKRPDPHGSGEIHLVRISGKNIPVVYEPKTGEVITALSNRKKRGQRHGRRG